MTSPRSLLRLMPVALLLLTSPLLVQCSALTRTLGVDRPEPHDAAKVSCAVLPYLTWAFPDRARALELLEGVKAGKVPATAATLHALGAALGDTPETVWQIKIMNARRDGLGCPAASEQEAAIPPLPEKLKGD